MKNLVLTYVALFCISSLLTAQKDSLRRSSANTWIKLNDNLVIKCVLFQVYDSSISVRTILKFTDHTYGFSEPININYKNIKVMAFRKRGQIARGIGLGTGIGFLFGGAIGSILPGAREMSSSEKISQILGVGAVLGVCGALIGGISSSSRTRIPIYSNYDNFNNNKVRLKQYSYFK